MCVEKGEWKLRHLLMVGAKLIGFTGNFTLRLDKAPGDLKDFSFYSDIIDEKLHQCGVWRFSFRGTNTTSSTTTARRCPSARR